MTGRSFRLPAGWSYMDKNGTERDHVRLQWWRAAARRWRDIAISVPVVRALDLRFGEPERLAW